MSFLVILLVLLVEKFSDWRPRLQYDSPWLTRLRQAEASPRLRQTPWLALLLLVLLPLLLLGLVLLALEPLAYGWLSLPVHLLVLLYSLGRGHAKAELGAFRDAWRRGDDEAAALAAEREARETGRRPAGAGPAEPVGSGAVLAAVAQLRGFFCGDLLVPAARADGGAGVPAAGAVRRAH